VKTWRKNQNAKIKMQNYNLKIKSVVNFYFLLALLIFAFWLLTY